MDGSDRATHLTKLEKVSHSHCMRPDVGVDFCDKHVVPLFVIWRRHASESSEHSRESSALSFRFLMLDVQYKRTLCVCVLAHLGRSLVTLMDMVAGLSCVGHERYTKKTLFCRISPIVLTVSVMKCLPPSTASRTDRPPYRHPVDALDS